MKHIGLFEGIGGFSVAAESMGWETIAWCEWNQFGKQILKHHYPNANEHDDITKTDFTIYRGKCDILTGGFPCQDASLAKQDGTAKGLEGERTGLWWHMVRAIGEIRPKYVVAENVANILKINDGRDFAKILLSLSGMGYNAEWRICYACEQGAPHKRKRMYLVAYPNSVRVQQGETFIPYVYPQTSPQPWRFVGATIPLIRSNSWSSEPPILLVDDGISRAMVRHAIKAAGNAIVPQVAMQIFKAIEQFEKTI